MSLINPSPLNFPLTRAVTSLIFVSVLLAACGGGGGGSGVITPPPPPTSTYTIGGSISGLTGSGLVLQNNAGNNLPVAAKAASFTFTTAVASGAAYAVTVLTQPKNPAQTCTVSKGSGTATGANITNVAIACTTNAYSVGGSISGLTGSGLVLQNNAGNNLPVAAKATSFTFMATSSASYAVTVLTQPTNPAQTCTVSNGSGTATGANITNVAISCTMNAYSVGGSISGLTGGGLVLQNNAGNNLPVAAKATSFTFMATSSASYAVTVKTQPTNPAQTCTVSNGSGTATGANVTNVAIACTLNVYTVGGSISGLTGSGLVLQDNAGDNLNVAAKATSFTFPTAIASGAAYAVTVMTQPATPTQVCSVANGTGTVGAANISNVAVSCVSVARFVFVANSTDGVSGTGDVSAFTINPNTGALTAVPGGQVTADLNPSAIAVDTSGQFAYVSNVNSSDVSIFIVDPVAGALTLKGNVYSPGTGGASIAVAPSDNYLFVAGYGTTTGSVYALTLDPNSGSLTAVPSSPFPAGDTPYGLAVDPASQFVFATTAFNHFLFAYTIGSDGSLTGVAGNPFSAGPGSYGVVAYPLGGATGGFVYTANTAANTVSAFSYDSTGNLTELTQQGSPYGVGSQPKGIAIDAAGKFLYVTNYADGTVSSFSINPQSGALTPVGTPVATGNLTSVPNPGPIDVKVDPSGQFVYVVNNLDGSVSLFTASAGVLTLSATYPTGTGAIGVAID
jgi:6-phosphogluconolactonase (cycloisomerase 2 family)